MKRLLTVLLILILATIGLSSCNIGGGPDGPDGPGEGGSASWEDFGFTAAVDENGILTWDFKGDPALLEGTAHVEVFRGGEIGIDPQTTFDDLHEKYKLEFLFATGVRMAEKRLDLAEWGLWNEPGEIYTVYLECSMPEGEFTYVFSFEKPEITHFLIEFIDGMTGELIHSFELPVGEAVTPEMYPELPADGVGYTVEWSEDGAFVPERNIEIVALYRYIEYPINYVYDEDVFEEVRSGHDSYTLMPDKDGTPWEYFFKTMFSEEKKFLGWSTEPDGEPMRILTPDRENPAPITVYLIWEDYTAEELEFYRLFEATLGLSKYTLTDIERDRLIAVDKDAGYAHRSYDLSGGKESYTVIWHGGYYYHLRDEYYCEKEFEEELAEIHELGLKRNFPRRNCATNIVKTADGYEFDIVFANESYHLTVKSNGNYFTAISGDYNKDYINATLTNTVEKLDIPTDFEFKVFPRTTVMNVDTNELILDTNNSYDSFEEFLYQFEEDFSSYDHQCEYIYLGVFTDEACTIPLTEDYYQANKGGRLKLYTKVMEKGEYLDAAEITVNIYIDYHLMPSGRNGSVMTDTLKLTIKELSTLGEYCKKYEGWGEYGYVSLDNLVVYDTEGLILQEDYVYLDFFSDSDFLQWVTHKLTEPVDGDYTLEARIHVEGEDPCLITIDGYGSFYDSARFRPEKWLIAKDGMVPSGYYLDAELTNPVPDGYPFESEVTLYCSWVKGEIISFTVYQDEAFNATITTTSTTALYDALSGYWCSSNPLFYDEKCTEFVNYDSQIEGGMTYYVNSEAEKVSFTIVCNGKSYELEGYENTSLDFNRFFWEYPYNDIERDLRDLDLYPDFSEEDMSALIKEGATYEIEAKEVPKYFIYLGDELQTSGYISGYGVEDFLTKFESLKSSYSSIRGYGWYDSKIGDRYIRKLSIPTYLTADLTTKEPYEPTENPTESINLYVVGDFFISDVTVTTDSGAESEAYVMTGDITVYDFMQSVLRIDDTWQYRGTKDGRKITDIYNELMGEGDYTFEYMNYIYVSVMINGEIFGFDVAEGTTLREFIEGTLYDILRDSFGIEDWQSCSIYKNGVRVTDFDSPVDTTGYEFYTDGR